MKRLLLWLIGVALGVVVLLAAVLGVSYSFTSEGAKPASEVQFAGQELEPNGWCWQVPLLGGQVDKVFASPRTLTVQKLGVLYDAHPAFALPEWYSYGPLTITDSAGNVVFEGTAATYDDFLFPANGDYKAELTVWRLPENMLATQFEGGSTGELRQDVRLEKPAKPIGWYYYSFRFTLQASAEVELSAERMEQGGTVAAAFTGMVGETAPTVETDLGNVQAVRLGSGWRAYIPAAYNAAAGAHEVTFTVGGETVVKNITVIPKDFGTVEIEAEPEASEAANTEFRNAVWPLYEQPAREKLWSGGFACPAENYMTLVDFGQTKVTDGKQGSKSNSTKLYTIPGDPCRAPRQRRRGAGPEPRPHRQHRRHRPRLRAAQLPLRAGCSLGERGPERGARAGRGRIGRRPDHGLQARQQEHQSVAALPDQRRAVLEREWVRSANRNLKGAFSMASKKVEMYAKKRYELDEIKNKIKEEFDKRKFSDVEFKDEIIRELGDTKTLLLIFENWFLRTGSYASLVIMLSEYQGYQSADIIATGGKEAFFSFGAEGDFAKFGEDALEKLGFQGKVR